MKPLTEREADDLFLTLPARRVLADVSRRTWRDAVGCAAMTTPLDIIRDARRDPSSHTSETVGAVLGVLGIDVDEGTHITYLDACVLALTCGALAKRLVNMRGDMVSNLADVVGIQWREAALDPSDAYMVGLYNGMAMMHANIGGPEFHPMKVAPKRTTDAHDVPPVPLAEAIRDATAVLVSEYADGEWRNRVINRDAMGDATAAEDDDDELRADVIDDLYSRGITRPDDCTVEHEVQARRAAIRAGRVIP